MSGNVVGRLCRAAHYSTWQKAFQFGTHRVSKRSLIIIMPTALLCCCCCCCAVLAMADIIVLKGVGRALYWPSLFPFLSLSFSTASLLWLVISAKSPPLVRSFVRRPDGLPVSAHWLHSFLPSHLIYAEIYKYQRYPFYPQREKLVAGELNGSARKKLRLRRDFNVIRECARIALILERRGNDKAHLPLVLHVI